MTTWTDPGPIEAGDYLAYPNKHGRPISALALRRECRGSVLVRNEHGIQREVAVADIIEHWHGCALAAGPRAQGVQVRW